MKRSHKFNVSIAAATSALLLLSGCSGSSSASAEGQVIWSTWGTPEELKVYETFNKQFSEKNADLKIKFQPVASYDEYHSKLNTQLTSRTAPDVFYVGDDQIANLVANDVLEPIDTCLALAGAEIKKADFAENLYRVAEKDGVTFALPNDVNPDAFFFDREALKAAGITADPVELANNDQWTFEKFFEMTAALQKAGLQGAAFWNYWATWQSILSASGAPAYDESGKFVADTAESAANLQKWADKFASGELVVADELPKGSDSDALFVTHKLGFMVQGRYTVATLAGAGLDLKSYDVVRWPTASGAAEPTGVAASFLAVNKNAKDKTAACKFFNAYLSKAGQTLRLQDNGNALPSISGVDNVVTDSGVPANVSALIEMRDQGFSNSPTEASVPGLSADIATQIMLPLFKGQQSAADALAEISQRLQKSAK
ncbi:extracellular solute-binding protein [Arcanobacterium hippocoleae]|uniref:extracellular solute-binding protein n=1 Tax=Arcanobacterium hippocoleae TaxID=149017 RepID=UPI0033413094